MVLGIPLHSFPWEGLFCWCKPPRYFPSLTLPHVHVQPHFQSLRLGWFPPTSLTGGDWGGGERSVWGEEEDARVLLWHWVTQLYFITWKNETMRSSPQFAEAVRWALGSSPCLWAPGLALYNT